MVNIFLKKTELHIILHYNREFLALQGFMLCTLHRRVSICGDCFVHLAHYLLRSGDSTEKR